MRTVLFPAARRSYSYTATDPTDTHCQQENNEPLTPSVRYIFNYLENAPLPPSSCTKQSPAKPTFVVKRQV
jgi:hypothetical protein